MESGKGVEPETGEFKESLDHSIAVTGPWWQQLRSFWRSLGDERGCRNGSVGGAQAVSRLVSRFPPPNSDLLGFGKDFFLVVLASFSGFSVLCA